MNKLHFFRLEGKEIKYICNAGGQTSQKNITNDYFKVTCPECKEFLVKERIQMELNKQKEEIIQVIKSVDTYDAIEEDDCILLQDLYDALHAVSETGGKDEKKD